MVRSILGNDRDVFADSRGRLDGDQSIYIPFTEGYFRSAAAVLSTKIGTPDAGTLVDLLKRHYGLTGLVTVLSSEVECTAEIALLTGEQLILKASSQPEAIDSFRFQAAVLDGLEGTSGFVVSSVLRTSCGSLMFEEGQVSGYLQTRLPGVPLHKTNAPPEILYRTGEALGRLNLALELLKLPAIFRPVLWHVGCWPRLTELEKYLPTGTIADCVRLEMNSYVECVEPQLAALTWQVTHNDPSPFNTLLTEQNVGFIDFGDGCWGPRIQDLAIAASHVVSDPSLPLGGAESLVAGYSSVIPLSSLEARLLPGLMKARQSALILINYWRAGLFPQEAEYIKKNVPRAERGLSILSSLSLEQAEMAVRRVASHLA